jgi:hypothetical protein
MLITTNAPPFKISNKIRIKKKNMVTINYRHDNSSCFQINQIRIATTILHVSTTGELGREGRWGKRFGIKWGRRVGKEERKR